jgi:hypothetical protein
VWALRMSRWHVSKNRHRRAGAVVPEAGRFRENKRPVHFSPDDDWRGEMIRADRRAILEWRLPDWVEAPMKARNRGKG